MLAQGKLFFDFFLQCRCDKKIVTLSLWSACIKQVDEINPWQWYLFDAFQHFEQCVFATQGVLVLPVDLPLLTTDDVLTLIDRAAKPPVIVIAPDRHHKGTNALLMVPAGLIEYEFGEGSFQRHCERAIQSGARLEIVDLPSLGLDLDDPEDLEIIRKMESTKV